MTNKDLKTTAIIILMPPKKTSISSKVVSKKETTDKETVVKPVEVKATTVTTFNDGSKKKVLRKAGRTLLVSPSTGSTLTESMFSGYTGLESTIASKNGSYFLTFDTVQNALDSYRKTRQDHPNVRVKFSHYKLFFTLTGLTDSSDYGVVKQQMSSFVEKESGAQVLYFKLYRKGNKFIGCGDVTVDTKASMDALLNKEGKLKNFSVEGYTGTFYRYNKNGPQEGNVETTA